MTRRHRPRLRMTMLGTVVLAALASALALAGCTPASPRAQAQAAQAQPAGSTASRPMTVGVDLYIKRANAGDVARFAARDLAYLRNVLDIRNVQIDWNLQSSGNQVERRPGMPSAQVISTVTKLAREDGLNVSYRILFDVPASSGHIGRIDPSDPPAWFASLYAAEKPYLEVAQQNDVREFVAGTERTTIEGNPLWRRFFTQAASVYHGTLSYASWGGRPGYGGVLGGSLSELPPVSDYGLTAYPEVPLPADAPQDQVTAAWEAFLRHLPANIRYRTALDEVGIPASARAYRQPWGWDTYSGAADNEVQARWFTAVCTAAAAEHLRGIWFFAAFLDDNPARPYPGLAKFEHRPASEAAIKTCAEDATGKPRLAADRPHGRLHFATPGVRGARKGLLPSHADCMNYQVRLRNHRPLSWT